MQSLYSDNVAGIHPRLLSAIAEANEGFAPSYAEDALTSELEAIVSALFGKPAKVFLTQTGTAANALSIAGLCPVWKRTLCHQRSHIMEAEAGAPEAFSGGGKLSTAKGGWDKLSVEGVSAALSLGVPGDPHSPSFGLVSLSQATECGTIYSLQELKEIAATVRRHDARLHLDGARFANAIAAMGLSPAEIASEIAPDAISFGIAKNGGAFCDLIVLFDIEKAEEFRFRQMRSGHLMAKHRFISAQALACLREGLWLELANHANQQAAVLANALLARNFATVFDVKTNLLFVEIDPATANRLQRQGAPVKLYNPAAFGRDEAAANGTKVLRLVTSWQTTDGDIARCLKALGP